MSIQSVARGLGRLASETQIRPVSGLIIVDGRGRVAMAYQEYANQGWCFPKGGIDHTETSAEAAVREAREEIGLEVELLAMEPLSFTGRAFHDSLGFGSPRVARSVIHKPVCRYFGERHEVTKGESPGDSISKGAYDLIFRAWTVELGFKPSEPEVLEVFDATRSMLVTWLQSPTYHLAAFRSHVPHEMTGETDEAAWVNPLEIIKRAGEGVMTLPRKMHGDVVRVAAMSGFMKMIELASASAQSSDRPGLW